MKRVLLTAFEPFGQHEVNSSLLCMAKVMSQPPANLEIECQVYPVDFKSVRSRVPGDLQRGFDVAIHLGQTNKVGAMKLELFALNVRKHEKAVGPLDLSAPLAYMTCFPLTMWAAMIEHVGVPATVSSNAGMYVCNALYFWSLHTIASTKLNTRSCFIHVPLCEQQEGDASLKLATADAAKALTAILQHIASQPERWPSL